MMMVRVARMIISNRRQMLGFSHIDVVGATFGCAVFASARRASRFRRFSRGVDLKSFQAPDGEQQ